MYAVHADQEAFLIVRRVTDSDDLHDSERGSKDATYVTLAAANDVATRKLLGDIGERREGVRDEGGYGGIIYCILCKTCFYE